MPLAEGIAFETERLAHLLVQDRENQIEVGLALHHILKFSVVFPLLKNAWTLFLLERLDLLAL